MTIADFGSVASLLGDMDAVKRRLQGGLTAPQGAFQLPQQPAQAPLMAPPPQTPSLPVGNPQAAPQPRRGGLLGAIGKALRPEVSPELGALLTDDQEQRVRPGYAKSIFGLLAGVTPGQQMQAGARNILNLQDEKTKRDDFAMAKQTAAQRALLQSQLQMRFAPMILNAATPEERNRILGDYIATAGAMGLDEAVKPLSGAASTVLSVPKAERAVPPVSRNTAQGVQNWNPATGKWEYEKDENGKNVMPFSQPLQSSYTIPSGVVGGSGKPVVFNSKTGRYEEQSDLAVKPSQATGARGRAIAEVLPTITNTVGKLQAFSDDDIKKLSATGVNLASVANKTSDSYLGVAGAAAASAVTSSQDRAYAQMVRAIADAVARANEVGILTNQDIARYESQVSFVSGDDEAMKRQKVKNAIEWAQWITRNKSSLVPGGKPSRMPGESATEYTKRTGVPTARPQW